MRQRRPKNLEEKINEHEKYLVRNPESLKDKWISTFDTPQGSSQKKLFLEIGSGKGRFINGLALKEKENFFIGFEGQDTVILRALEKVSENQLANLVMCQYYINDFNSVFGHHELDGIYLNFSDPWPKDRHAKRRLTSPKYLDGYANSLKPGSFIKMKTDNDGLFQYSIEQLEMNNEFEIIEKTEDLHSSKWSEDNIMTEYEKKFSNLNKKINYVCALRK